MLRKLIVCLALLGLVATGAVAQKPENKGREEGRATKAKARPLLEGTGVVRYDPGAPADTFHKNGASFTYGYYGNNFDTRNGQPLSPGTITGVSWYQGGPGNYATIGLVDFAPIGGTVSTQLTLGPGSTYAFNAITANVAFPGTKWVGLALGFDAFGSVGARSASTNNQGFHGLQRNWTGGYSVSMPGQNVMLRVSGTLVVPVELMEFDIE